MAICLESWSRLKVRAVMLFLRVRDVSLACLKMVSSSWKAMPVHILLAKLKICWEISSGKSGATPPPYSPNLAPSVYFLFPILKEHVFGTRFVSDIDVKRAVENWLNGQEYDFYQPGLNNLRSNKCLNRFGVYMWQRDREVSLLIPFLIYVYCF